MSLVCPPGPRLFTFKLIRGRLEKIYAKLGNKTPLVLHGTHPLSDDLLRSSMTHGIVKVNQNRNIRLGYHEYIEKNCGNVELTELQMQGVEEYAIGVERMFEVFGSAGRFGAPSGEPEQELLAASRQPPAAKH